MAFEDNDNQAYVVLINDEGQYSLWPKSMRTPAGWAASGFEGSKSECTSYVEEVWKDMRPKSLRDAMSAS